MTPTETYELIEKIHAAAALARTREVWKGQSGATVLFQTIGRLSYIADERNMTGEAESKFAGQLLKNILSKFEEI